MLRVEGEGSGVEVVQSAAEGEGSGVEDDGS